MRFPTPRVDVGLDLEVDDISMRYGDKVIIDRMRFSVAQGDFLCIVGASGCGKTTLLRMMAGLSRPTGGSVRFRGEEVTRASRRRAIVFQDYARALLPWRTVAQNIALSLECADVPRSEHAGRVDELGRTMNLGHAMDRYPHQLSGGMQQRVQIARCLAQQPDLLLMDEPFGALDAITRQHLQDEVARIAAQRNMTVVFITHDLEEAIYLGDRVIVLGAHPGRIIEDIAVDIERPRHQLTTREDPRFLSLRHRLHGLLEGH